MSPARSIGHGGCALRWRWRDRCHGSATSGAEIIGVGLLVRSEGVIVAAPDPHPAHFDFGDRDVECTRLSFGDLVTSWKSTRIPNIDMFVHVKGNAFPSGDLTTLGHDIGSSDHDTEALVAIDMQAIGASSTAIGHAGLRWLLHRERTDNESLRRVLGTTSNGAGVRSMPPGASLW